MHLWVSGPFSYITPCNPQGVPIIQMKKLRPSKGEPLAQTGIGTVRPQPEPWSVWLQSLLLSTVLREPQRA